MPGVERLSVDLLPPLAERILELGIPAVALFPVTPPERKSEDAAEAWNDDNLMGRAIRALKRRCPELGLIGPAGVSPGRPGDEILSVWAGTRSIRAG